MGKKNSISNIDGLLTFLNKRRVATSKELEKFLPARAILKRLVDEGKLQPLGAGLYAANTLDPFHASVIAVAAYYPEAVISNLTAMVIHGLSDERIDRIDVDIDRGTSIRNKLLAVHRVPIKRLTGIEKAKFHGATIKIYDTERTLCEASFLDPGGPILFKALKRYIKRQTPNTTAILKYDGILGTQVLRHIQQELADA